MTREHATRGTSWMRYSVENASMTWALAAPMQCGSRANAHIAQRARALDVDELLLLGSRFRHSGGEPVRGHRSPRVIATSGDRRATCPGSARRPFARPRANARAALRAHHSASACGALVKPDALPRDGRHLAETFVCGSPATPHPRHARNQSRSPTLPHSRRRTEQAAPMAARKTGDRRWIGIGRARRSSGATLGFQRTRGSFETRVQHRTA